VLLAHTPEWTLLQYATAQICAMLVTINEVVYVQINPCGALDCCPDHHRPGERASLALPSNLPFSEWVKSVRSGPAAELNHRRDCISGGLSTDKLMDTR
jgi:hypothetical protein